MQQRVPAVVRAIQQPTGTIEIKAPGIAASLAKQLELASNRMISPNTLLKLDAANGGRNGAFLTAIQPTVGAEGERIRNAVSILHPESRQQNFGVRIGNIVTIAIGIKQ